MITEEQRLMRRNGLGGSDIAGIVPSKDSKTGTLSPWCTQVDIWNSKVGPIEAAPQESEAMWWGSQEEDLVAKRFTEFTGKRLVNYNKTIVDGCLIANLDRLIIPDGEKIAAFKGEIRTTEIFEAKTSGMAWNEAPIADTLPNGTVILNGDDGVPLYYQTQINHYLGRVPTAEKAYIGVKFSIACRGFSRTEFGIYLMERDAEVIAAQDEYAREWWKRYIIGGEKPAPVCEEDCRIIWKRSIPASRVSFTRDDLVNLKALRKAKEDAKIANDEVARLEGEIKLKMGESENLTSEDGTTILATWKNTRDSIVTKIDWEALARAKGVTPKEIDEATTKEVKTGARRFSPKFNEKCNSFIDSMLAEMPFTEQSNGATPQVPSNLADEGEHENE